MTTTKVGQTLEKVIWEVHQIEKIVETGGHSEDRVLDKIDDLVKILAKLREAAAETEAEDANGDATSYPVDLLRHIDEGCDVVCFMSNGLLDVGEANKITVGKANIFRKFHEALVKEDEAQPEGTLQLGVSKDTKGAA